LERQEKKKENTRAGGRVTLFPACGRMEGKKKKRRRCQKKKGGSAQFFHQQAKGMPKEIVTLTVIITKKKGGQNLLGEDTPGCTILNKKALRPRGRGGGKAALRKYWEKKKKLVMKSHKNRYCKE